MDNTCADLDGFAAGTVLGSCLQQSMQTRASLRLPKKSFGTGPNFHSDVSMPLQPYGMAFNILDFTDRTRNPQCQQVRRRVFFCHFGYDPWRQLSPHNTKRGLLSTNQSCPPKFLAQMQAMHLGVRTKAANLLSKVENVSENGDFRVACPRSPAHLLLKERPPAHNSQYPDVQLAALHSRLNFI